MADKGYKRLIAWQKADALAFQIYLATKNFPPEEIYGITSQLRRAALSIPTNVVEGFARRNPKELKQFLSVSLSSLAEVEYLLDFAHRLRYIATDRYKELETNRDELGKVLWAFHKSILMQIK